MSYIGERTFIAITGNTKLIQKIYALIIGNSFVLRIGVKINNPIDAHTKDDTGARKAGGKGNVQRSPRYRSLVLDGI